MLKMILGYLMLGLAAYIVFDGRLVDRVLPAAKREVTTDVGVTTCRQISAEQRADLKEKARGGDWRAARDLALERFWCTQTQDAETLALVRMWSSHDNGDGMWALAELLSQSCKRADRDEAVEIFTRYKKTEHYLRSLETSDFAEQSYKDYLERVRELAKASIDLANCLSFD